MKKITNEKWGQAVETDSISSSVEINGFSVPKHEEEMQSSFFSLCSSRNICLAMIAFTSSCISGFAYAGTYSDNFNSGINSSAWTIQTDGSATVAAVNNQVEMTLGNNLQGARLVFNTPIIGNFDARIDYTLLNWPAKSEAGITLGTGFVDMLSSDLPVGLHGFVGGGSAASSGGNAYFSDLVTTGHQVFSIPTTDMSGKLRITKVGGDIGIYDWNGASWSEIHTYINGQRDTTINLIEFGLFRVADPGVKVAFDNFSITAPSTTLPVPEPGEWAMMLGGLGLMGFIAMRRAKAEKTVAMPA